LTNFVILLNYKIVYLRKEGRKEGDI